MIKKILSIFLCALLVLTLPLSVLATQEEAIPEETVAEENPLVELTIGSAEAFLTFAENCRLDSYSRNLTVTLTADLDLTGTDFEGVPIFCGSFDGADHTITYTMTREGSAQGLFRYLSDTAVVENLSVSAELHPGGSRSIIGGIAGENAGTIRACSFSGSLQGSDSIGGIVGCNTVTGIIDSCTSEGSIHGNHFVGGIAGQSQGVIRSCSNQAAINTTPQQNTVELSDITIESITTSESSGTTTDIGGIAGLSTGVIRSCANKGDVGYRQMGYNVGGIAGTQSGYIVDCKNYGSIAGRKEVGGIAGQMEPAAKIEYTQDTLQILEEQLDTMSGLASRATANAQNSASSIAGQMAGLQDQVLNAQDAIDQMVPKVDPENPDAPVEVPDMDSLQAAQAALSSAMSGMQSNLNSIASTAQGMAYNLSRDMSAITNQMDAMGQTIRTAEEGLGGSVTDISDLDTEEDISGKVAYCSNHGSVQADINAGGIAGAIALENDLDIQDDLEVLGEASLNFESELRAVILGCENNAQVSVNKQCGGGVAGLMTMGLVKNSANTGAVLGENADYTGGIAGQSQGYIRSSSAKCSVDGSSYVGGIAGSGTVVSDCRAMNLLSGKEKLGGLLGSADSRESITGNYYVASAEDPGAIDGISYDGAAQSLDVDTFLSLESLPSMFRSVTVSFRSEEGIETVTLPLGGTLASSDIPDLPEKTGYTVTWEGLEEGTLLFDHTVEAVYTPLDTVIASQLTRSDTQPILLAQGSFAPEQTLELSALDPFPRVQKGQTVLEGWTFRLPAEQDVTLRYLPENSDAHSCRLWVRSDGAWKEASFTPDGSYLVFSAGADADAFCFVTVPPNYILYGAIAILILAAVITSVILIRKKVKKA